jgi:hypothetical protein
VSLDLYERETQERLSTMQPVEHLEAGTWDGFARGTGLSAMRGLARIGRTIDMAGAVGPILKDAVTGGTELQDRYFREHDEVWGSAVDYWTPKRGEVGVAGEIAGQLLSLLPVVLASPGLAVADAYLGTAEDLVKQGVDAGKAQAVGAVQAVGLGLGIWVPILGRNGWERILVGGAGFNVAQGITMRGVSGAILEGTPAAKAFEAFDGHALTLDVLLGLAFGSFAHLNPEMRAQGAKAWERIGAWAQKLEPSELAAIAALRQAQHANVDSFPGGKPAGPQDIEAHVNRLRVATEQILRGEPVHVEDMPAPKTEAEGLAEVYRGEDLAGTPIELTVKRMPSGEILVMDERANLVDITAMVVEGGKTVDEAVKHHFPDVERVADARTDTPEAAKAPGDEAAPARDDQAGVERVREAERQAEAETRMADAERRIRELGQVAEEVRVQEGLPHPPEPTTPPTVEALQGRDIATHVRERLEATGMPVEEASANAALWEAFYRTTAKRMGLTPEELHARYPIDITRDAPEGVDVLDQKGYGGARGRPAETPQEPEKLRATVGGGAPAQGWVGATRASRAGRPIPLYRGARAALTPEKFAPEALGRASGNPSSGLGVWFTPNKTEAATYGAHVEEVYLDIRNPKVIKIEELPGFESTAEATAFREQLRAQGHDSIVVTAKHLGGKTHIVAFDPAQVIPNAPAAPAAAKMSNTHVGAAFKRLVSEHEQDMHYVLMNWNDVELTPDGEMVGYTGRDRQFSRGADGGTHKPSKREFLRWLFSDEPLDPKTYDLDDEWRGAIERLRSAAKEAVGRASSDGGVLFQMAEKGERFYSELARQVDAAKMNQAPAQGWKDWLKSLSQKGVKAEEIKWTGIEEWLDLQQGKVTKEQVQQFLANNGVRVEEVLLGGPLERTLGDTAIARETAILREHGYTPELNPEDNAMVAFHDAETDDIVTANEILQFSKQDERLTAAAAAAERIEQYWAGTAVAGTRNPNDTAIAPAVAELENEGFEVRSDPGANEANGDPRWYVLHPNADDTYATFDDVEAAQELTMGMRNRIQRVLHYLNDETPGWSAAEPGPEQQVRPTKFGQYQLPGGKNYRELLLTLPHDPEKMPKGWRVEEMAKKENSSASELNELQDEYRKWLSEQSLPQESADEVVALLQRDHPRGSRPAAVALQIEYLTKFMERWESAEERSRLAAGHRYVLVGPDGVGTILDAGARTLEQAMDAAMKYLDSRGILDQGTFRESHWETPNVLAHVRLNERTDAEGKRTLFIEEIQSDWAQKGKKRGFQGQRTVANINKDIDVVMAELYERGELAGLHRNDVRMEAHPDLAQRYEALIREMGDGQKGVPAGPFVQKTEAWVGLVMKRVIAYAAENGFERVAWTTGEQQTARYTSALRKAVDAIEWTKTDKGVQIVGYKGGVPTQMVARRIAEATAALKAARAREDQARVAMFGGKSPRELMGEPKLVTDEKTIGSYGVELEDGQQMLLYEGGYILKNRDGSYMVPVIQDERHFPANQLEAAERYLLEEFMIPEGMFDHIPADQATRDAYEAARQATYAAQDELGNAKRSTGKREKVVDTTEKEDVLSDAIGKAMADRILGDANQSGVIEGEQIVVADTGMASFYERIVPNVAKEILKKLGGGKVGKTRIDTGRGATSDNTQLELAVRGTEAPKMLPIEEGSSLADAFQGAESFRSGEQPLYGEGTLKINGVEHDVAVIAAGDGIHVVSEGVPEFELMLDKHHIGAGTSWNADFASRLVDDLWNGANSLIDQFALIRGEVQGKSALTEQPAFDITPAMKEKVEGGLALFQRSGKTARGYMKSRVGEGGTSAIGLLENANRSTFLHESGHFFLEVTNDLARATDAPAQLKADMQALYEWMGVKDAETWNAMTLEERRPGHEKFARGFEQYLRDGKAPSEDLRTVFQIFKDWLIEIYKSAASLKVKVSDEVRAVMDRMLAEQKADGPTAKPAGSEPPPPRGSRKAEAVGPEAADPWAVDLEAERAAAEAGPAREPLTLEHPKMRKELEQMAQYETGWEVIGGRLDVGRLIAENRKDQGGMGGAKAPDLMKTGKVAFTPWIPKAEWWRTRPGKMNEAQVKEAVRKALAGEPLKMSEQRMVDYMLEVANERTEAVEQVGGQEEWSGILNDIRETGLEPVTRDVVDADLVAKAMAIDEARVESAAIRYDNDDAAFMAEIRATIDEAEKANQDDEAARGGEEDRGAKESRDEPAGAPGDGEQGAGADPLAAAAQRYVDEQPHRLLTVGTNADGTPIYKTAQEFLEDARADAAQAREDAKLFQIAAECMLGGGRS